ncbi:CPBP family intramembrane glutamic endopeptidase [Lactococcus kimchii]|uniref:CPBP family intramembrane glutamic endopeptidase n=1 Tax=Lactococcus sp. S-13 TaxID=2507158 RepID=UPI001022AFA4|nr:CPBP family intramembrane glutamic endopeptidase [Lactococcus sp. S-13]RZI49579.1 CPBP family intramembrane metalloprotease [Lactococcus sp. S-13]
MKKIISILVILVAYIVGLSYVLKALGVNAWLDSLGGNASMISIFIQEIPLILILLLLNHFFWHQKLLFKRYPWNKSLGMLILPFLFFLSGLVVALRFHFSASYILLVFFATLLIGAAEELSFRGLIFGLLVKRAKNRAGFILALFSSSILFGLIHLLNLRHQPLPNTIIQVLAVIPVGLVLAAIYVKTNNLLFAILLHAMNDFTAILASGGGITSEQTNPLSILIEWFLFGTLAFVFLYTSWTQKERFIAAIQARAPQLSPRKLPALAQNVTFRRMFALIALVYSLLPLFLIFKRANQIAATTPTLSIPNQTLSESALMALVIISGLALFTFLIVFFDFHLANLCWFLLPYVGGSIFALLVLLKVIQPKNNQPKSNISYADKA